MKNNTINALFLGVLLLCSCSSSKSEQNSYSMEELINTEKTINLSELNADIKYIQLETTPEAIVGSPTKIICSGKYIYVLSAQPNSVVQFTSEGKFVRQISSIGRSGSEYLYANDIFIDGKEHLYISDMGSGKILKFDLNGGFISFRKNDIYVYKSYINVADYLFESIQVILGNEPFKLVVKNILDHEIISRHFNNVKYKLSSNSAGYQDTKSIFELNNDVIYHQMSSDTVYTYNFNTKNLDVRYSFINQKPLNAVDYEQFSFEVDNVTFIYDIAEDDNYIYVTFVTPHWVKELRLIDKKNGTFLKSDFKISNDLNKTDQDVLFYPKWQNDNILIDCVQLDDELNSTIVLIKPKSALFP